MRILDRAENLLPSKALNDLSDFCSSAQDLPSKLWLKLLISFVGRCMSRLITIAILQCTLFRISLGMFYMWKCRCGEFRFEILTLICKLAKSGSPTQDLLPFLIRRASSRFWNHAYPATIQRKVFDQIYSCAE